MVADAWNVVSDTTLQKSRQPIYPKIVRDDITLELFSEGI